MPEPSVPVAFPFKERGANPAAFYIFYHNEKSLSLIETQGMPEYFHLVDLRKIPIPDEFKISTLSEKQNQDLFSESLGLLSLKPTSEMIGIFPYSIPLKFSAAWADKTGNRATFLPPVKFSDFYDKTFDSGKLYGVEFADFWHREDKCFLSIKKYIGEIHDNPKFRVGEDKIRKGPFKNSMIVKAQIFTEFQQWFRVVISYILERHGWNLVNVSDLVKNYSKSFHTFLACSDEQAVTDKTLRWVFGIFLEVLCAYYFGQRFNDSDKIDLKFFKGFSV